MFRAVVLTTFVFSIPDVVGFISPSEGLKTVTSYIPFANQSLGWVLPAFLVFILTSMSQLKMKNT